MIKEYKSENYWGETINFRKDTTGRFGFEVNLNDGGGWSTVPATTKDEAYVIVKDIINQRKGRQIRERMGK